MQKVVLRDKELTILTDPIAKGASFLGFSLTAEDFSERRFDSLDRKSVFSVFPAIHTGVCDQQGRSLKELADRHPDIDFFSVSVDLPPTLKSWCDSNKADNIKLYSDYKTREFGRKFGLLIDELQILTRAIFVVSKEGIVEYCEYKKVVTEAIDFKTLESFL